jgi:hypothetical protein
VLVDGVAVGRVVANRYRADLAGAGLVEGRHGFRIELAPMLRSDALHLVSLRRASDGAELPGSPVLLPAIAPPAQLANPAALPALLDAAASLGGAARCRPGLIAM